MNQNTKIIILGLLLVFSCLLNILIFTSFRSEFNLKQEAIALAASSFSQGYRDAMFDFVRNGFDMEDERKIGLLTEKQKEAYRKINRQLRLLGVFGD